MQKRNASITVKTGMHGSVLPPRRREALALLGPVVYAVRAGSFVKIGYTGNLGTRLRSMGSTKVLAFKPAKGFADELAIHERLSGHALKGREWYSPTDPAVIAIINEMREPLGLPLLTAA